MSVHYKFKSALEYDTVTFDGLHISVKDLKNAIIQQKRIGKNTDFDLQVTNAQTKEVYEDENVLIPKNTSLLIARIPTSAQNKQKQWEGYGGDNTPPTKLDEGGPIAKAVDLSSLDAPEDDKIKAMISQSTQDYDPSNYMKIRGANQMGAVPPNYRCYKCHQTGHWIKDCPLSKGPEPIEIKKSTGIPLSFMVPVEGPQVQGAMMTPNGSYAVPVLDHQTYTQKQTTPAPPIQESKPEIPEDLVCSICSDLLTDAVMIPCCGNSFCDECIRSFLLESEEHECPDCHEKDISPATLIPNRFLRNSVANFKNTTGYVKKPVYKQQLQKKPLIIDSREEVVEIKIKEAPDPVKTAEPTKIEEEKTVISEADSTEHSKNCEEKESELKNSPKFEPEGLPEGPPGVSPAESPKGQSISKRVNSSREPRDRSGNNPRQHKHRSRDESPRRHHRNHRSSPYRESGRSEERPGTPTIDEPGVTSNYPPPYNAPPMMGLVPPMQGPPPAMPYANPPAPMGNFPPTSGPPPNFRMPPPGTAPPYIPQGPYQVPPRPMFDTTRPPMTGPPPIYNQGYQRGHHRDYGLGDRRMRGRTPSGRTYRVIDDPLAAFNRMLREKDERERRAKRQRRSYSRSRSRSRSYSRSPRRMRSRSPRRRQSRSRSRSFTISRSRSRSFSGSLRGSPFRDFSPRHSPPRRRGPSRYRSPIRSPPRHRFKDAHQFRDRSYDHEHDRDRDYSSRDDRAYSRDREHRTRDDRDRDRDYGYYDGYEDRGRGGKWNGGQRGPPPPPAPVGPQTDQYYPGEMQHSYPPPPPNRYPPRDYPPPYPSKEAHVLPPNLMTTRRYEDVPPPGVEEPPIPGLENTRFEDRFDRFPSPGRQKREDSKSREKKKQHERSKSPEKRRKESPEIRRRSKSKDKESPDKHKKKKRDGSSDKDKKTGSDDDKSKKNRDKKKKKEKKEADKKKRKEKKEKHKEKKHKDDDKSEKQEEAEQKHKEEPIEQREEEKKEQKTDLYDDMLSEGVDTNVIESYGKVQEKEEFEEKLPEKEKAEEPEMQKDFDDSEKDILDLHPNDIDLKTEIDTKNEMLAHLPEKSKWEVEEDIVPQSQASPGDSNKFDPKFDKSGKVTNEVLKRAENAIFAKAINAIRPIEIKKISTDRAKLYSGEKDEDDKSEEMEIKSTSALAEDKSSDRKKIEAPSQPPRLSVKERLGIKIDDIDRTAKVDRNKSRSISPFTRRVNEVNRNYGIGERRVEIVDRRRRERSRHRERGNRRDFRRDDFVRRDRRDRPENRRDEKRRDRSKSKSKTRHEIEKKDKRRRSKSRSDSEERRDKRRRKEKRVKKEKIKKNKEDDDQRKEEEKVDDAQKIKSAAEKRKPTIDEATFEPDYDLESESDKDDKREKKGEERKSSSSSDSSDSSSEDDKKRKKHKKHRKKRSRKDSSSSSSDSESDSSNDDKDRKRKKHKKRQKKRKKSKHK